METETFAKSLRSTLHRRFYSYWCSKLRNDRIPSRQDIDPADIPDMLPWLTLVDILWDGAVLRPRSRLVGTGIVTRFGRDITGLYADEAYSSEYLAQVIETYAIVVKTGRPHYTRLRIPVSGREFVKYDRILLPLATEEKTVDMIFGCFSFTDHATTESS